MADQPPRVFISYSRENHPHIDWVRRLAEDLERGGVEARLDQWDLPIGADIAQFMEEAVQSADYVLLICTPDYGKKFNTRVGGVGSEADLMLGQLLTQSDVRGRIIPVLRSGVPSEAVPRYLRSKLYSDFTSDEQYEMSLDQLKRRLFNAPKYTRPERGSPSFAPSPVTTDNVHSSPKAWVLVAGTGSNDLPEDLKQTSKALGKMLAEKSYGVVTGGWAGVDEIVARAFSESLSTRGCAPENFLTQVVNETKMPAYPAGNLILVRRGEEEWTEQVKRSDAIVLIGGIGGTWKTGEYGLQYGKPVFPLADTRGDAKKFYMHMLKNWRDDFFSTIDRMKFQAVARGIPGVVNDLAALLELVRQS